MRIGLISVLALLVSVFGTETRAEPYFSGLGHIGSYSDGRAFGVSGDGLVVVGRDGTSAGPQAFRWTQSSGMVGLGLLPGGSVSSVSFGVSADGAVIVGSSHDGTAFQPFGWTQSGGMVGLGVLPGNSSSDAYDVSADGSVIVGVSRGGASPRKAFIWDAECGMQELKQVLTYMGLDLSGWELSEARGISDDGRTVVGEGENLSEAAGEAWIAVLPDAPLCPAVPGLPASGIALLATALLATGACEPSLRRSQWAQEQ